ncbi:lysozyme inhibitor LprI family protein [Massilia sp. S19_KUP03_FR1]|uniref:lysozyme inhibitor LprI family protein n=1 Tax=Massilia sp. S19_KUP03_FR1 TaxID=3025503 RepID=UPI002FCD97A7
MRIIALIVLGAVLAQMPASFAAGAAKRDECAAGSQAEMRRCLEKTSLASAATLAAAEKAALSALSRWDEDDKYRQAAAAALNKLSKSFSGFRQVQCDFVSALGGGAIGNALALRRLRCISDLNQRQAEMLRLATSDLPEK